VVEEAVVALVDGTIIAEKKSEIEVDRKSVVTSSGMIRNYAVKFYVGEQMTLEGGAELHNSGVVTLSDGGSIVGDGIIYNGCEFLRDDPLTERANADTDQNGFMLNGNDEYGYPLLSDEQIREEATYFDLVNSTGIRDIYKPSKAVIITPEDGRIPGTNDERTVAKKYVTAQVTSDLILPTTTGNEESPDEFFARNTEAYDVSHETINLNVSEPTYVGASLYSAAGYDGQGVRVFTVNGTAYSLPDVDRTAVITQTGPTGTIGNTMAFEPWYMGNSGISRFYHPRESLPQFEVGDDKGDPVAIYAGDNSWHNGVFNVYGGGVIIDNAGAMFGGIINLGRVGDEREIIHQDGSTTSVTYDTPEELHAALSNPDDYERKIALAYARQTPPVEFESQGGAKDECNRPVINMNGNATLYFNIPLERDIANEDTLDESDANAADTEGHRIFSLYGDVIGTPTDRIVFQKGTVLVKGNCSGFRGQVGVCGGSRFEVRTSDIGSSSVYKGAMFGGTFGVVDEYGNPDPNGQLDIDSTSGLCPLTLTCGTTNVYEGERREGGNAQKVDEITVSGHARVNMLYDNVDLNDTAVRGEKAVLALMNGERATLNGFVLDGGTLIIAGDELAEVDMRGPVSMGSAITAWTNHIVDDIVVNGANSLNVDGLDTRSWSLTNDVRLYFDFDPSKNEADHFTSAIGITSGLDHTFVLNGVRLISRPTQERHVFTLLDFGNAGDNRYPEIAISNDLTVIKPDAEVNDNGVDVDANGIYPKTTGGDGTPGAVIDNVPYYFYGSNRAGRGKIMMTRNILGYELLEPVGMLVAGLKDAGLSGVTAVGSNNTFDEFGFTNRDPSGRYSIWNKTHAAKYNISTDAGGSRLTKYGSMIGVDGKTIQLEGMKVGFVPTAYVAITKSNLDLNSYKSGINEYTGGVKGSWFDATKSLETQVSYSHIKFKTRNNPTLGLNATSSAVNCDAKFGYSLAKIANVIIRPEVTAGYSWIHTSKLKSATDADININNLHRVSLIPGLSFISHRDTCSIAASVKYVKQFGSKSKVTFGGETIKNIDKLGKGSFEMSLNIEKRISPNTKLALKLTQSIGGLRGAKATLSFGIQIPPTP
jgi:hypothetical protein